jgi:hypothetical protein
LACACEKNSIPPERLGIGVCNFKCRPSAFADQCWKSIQLDDIIAGSSIVWRPMQYTRHKNFLHFSDILSSSYRLYLLFWDLSRKLASASWSPSCLARYWGAGISNRMKLQT